MINGYAHINGDGGYNVHARGFFSALNRLTAVCLAPFDSRPDRRYLDAELLTMIDRVKSIDLANPALCLDYANGFHRFAGSYRIGYTVFENTRLGADWINGLQQVDEVWTTSQWGRQVLLDNGIDSGAVEVIGEGFDPTVFFPRRANANDEVFTFVSVGKWEPRKGQAMLLRAWSEVFGDRQDVRLLALWHNPFVPNLSLLDAIKALKLDPVPNVKLFNPLADAQQMALLYNMADCFVLPTRAEGWGLPMMEAMACGLPVITTDYSAMTEYLDAAHAYPLSVERLVDIHDPLFFPDKGSAGVWAEPDYQQLKALLRHVVDHRDEAREKGRMAARAMREQWTWEHAAEAAFALLGRRGLVGGQSEWPQQSV